VLTLNDVADKSMINAKEDRGFHKDLKSRQIQMMAIGGAIGTGLFLGSGARLAAVGPAIVLVYAVCGICAFMVMRALGELIMHRPTTGSFVSYSREFFGEGLAFYSGWIYWLHWAMTAIADITAAAVYMNFFKHYIPILDGIDQWTFALAALIFVLSANMLSVKVFGELEFWFSLIKVAALCVFLVVGIGFVIFGTPINGITPGLDLISSHGGFFPNGWFPALLTVQGVIFAYASIELVGTTAGEAANPQQAIPRAIRGVVARLILFYVGGIALLAMLLPYTAYKAGESPFVTFFSSINVQGSDLIMNLIVLTAVLSSLNAGLYATGRILHSMASAGSAPAVFGRINRLGIPYNGILLTAAVAAVGVWLNAVMPSRVFEFALSLSALGTMSSWFVILLCQLKLWKMASRGLLERPSFRMMGAPYTGIFTLLFLVAVIVLLAFDYPFGSLSVAGFASVSLILALTWQIRKMLMKRRDPMII